MNLTRKHIRRLIREELLREMSSSAEVRQTRSDERAIANALSNRAFDEGFLDDINSTKNGSNGLDFDLPKELMQLVLVDEMSLGELEKDIMTGKYDGKLLALIFDEAVRAEADPWDTEGIYELHRLQEAVEGNALLTRLGLTGYEIKLVLDGMQGNRKEEFTEWIESDKPGAMKLKDHYDFDMEKSFDRYLLADEWIVDQLAADGVGEDDDPTTLNADELRAIADDLEGGSDLKTQFHPDGPTLSDAVYYAITGHLDVRDITGAEARQSVVTGVVRKVRDTFTSAADGSRGPSGEERLRIKRIMAGSFHERLRNMADDVAKEIWPDIFSDSR